jgi:shikimate kinase
MSQRPVVVVGLMGSGKTTVASRLATALGRPFRDSDVDLEQRYGASAAEQYATHGRRVLHAREAAHLRQALSTTPPPVVAAAASVVDDPDCRAALAEAYVVWLHAPPQVLAGRISPVDHRPHYDPDPLVMLERQYRQRADRFAAVADLTVEVAVQTPQETVQAVLAGLTAAPDRTALPAARSVADR